MDEETDNAQPSEQPRSPRDPERKATTSSKRTSSADSTFVAARISKVDEKQKIYLSTD